MANIWHRKKGPPNLTHFITLRQNTNMGESFEPFKSLQIIFKSFIFIVGLQTFNLIAARGYVDIIYLFDRQLIESQQFDQIVLLFYYFI